ncbi:fibronectin type III domain-containing protein [Patescibacteria group bacterium]|nr:fibronectin type III domain-containing protein [Patescibacteria group bacterium]
MKKIVFTVVSLALLGSIYVASAFAQVASTSSMGEKGRISVSLESPTSVDTAAKTLQGELFDVVSVQGSFTMGGQTIQDFTTITPNQGGNDVYSKWSDGRKTLIVQLKKSGFFEKNSKFASTDVSVDDSATFMVKNITVYGDEQSVLKIVGKFNGTRSNFESRKNANTLGATASKKPNGAQPVSPIGSGQIQTLAATANTPYYTLVPVSGSVVTGLFTAPGITNPTRGVVNYMNWNSNGFASDQTYEHDFFLSANQGTYFARSFSLPPYCQPNAVYAATSWPSASYPYLDSDLESNGLCSSSGNIAYSIGAAQANAITSGVTHFTAILMPNGDATTDTFILEGQVGYRSPTFCHDTLCSFPYGYINNNATTHYRIITGGTVPSTRSWTFTGVIPKTPDQISVTNPSASSLRLNFRDITWDETDILVERRVGATGSWTAFTFGILNTGNSFGNWRWDNTGLSSGTQYCYRMRARNAIGSSAYSPIMCGQTL